MKALFFVMILAVSQLFAGQFALYSSFHSNGAVSGGLKYGLNQHVCFDASVGGHYGDEWSADIYADVFFYKTVLGVTSVFSIPENGDVVTTVGLAYSLEKPVAKDITLAITPTLISKTFREDTGIDILSGWDIGLAIYF